MRISDWSSDVCSSDLPGAGHDQPRGDAGGQCAAGAAGRDHARLLLDRPVPFDDGPGDRPVAAGGRSEEHTSELQSLMRISYAVSCWKKKKTQTHPRYSTSNAHARTRKSQRLIY